MMTRDQGAERREEPSGAAPKGSHADVQTFVVAQDFSACADRAMEVAARDAEALGGRLVLLHVSTTPPAPMGFDWLPKRNTYTAWKDLRVQNLRAAEQHMADRVERLRREHPGLEVEALVREGFPAEVILTVAHKAGASRVVIGTHGSTGFTRLLLGSVAEKVVRLSEIPVLVVKTPPHREPGEGKAPR